MRIENLAGKSFSDDEEKGQTSFSEVGELLTGETGVTARAEKKKMSSMKTMRKSLAVTDELPLGKSRGRAIYPPGKLVISDIRQGVKNPDRANIFINGKFEFSLDIAQVVDLKVRIGREITEEELNELKRASEFGKLYQRTLEWVLVRPRSVKETKDYLRRKIYEKKLDSAYLYNIIDILSIKKYLDDRKFAEYYAENRFVKKGISRKRLTMELYKKGVDKGIVEEVLAESGRDETEEARKMIAKKRGRYTDEKLIAYLVRQGFSYQLAKELVEDTSENHLG